MRYNIKAIETEYKGHLFRSRLEARWAAFFDLCGWKWTYEPADFNGWFPDFALHGVNDVFVEVKPDTSFPQDVADKIDASGCEHECLILGSACPLPSSQRDANPKWCAGTVHLGWLREQGTDDGCKVAGEWLWGEAGICIGDGRDFCHVELSTTGRMRGVPLYRDNSPFLTYDDAQALWGAAQRQTRYERQKVKPKPIAEKKPEFLQFDKHWEYGRITLTNYENCDWRFERLKNVILFLKNRAPHTLQQIIRLDDHKGDLTCFWNDLAKNSSRDFVEDAWESVGELKCNVDHRD